MNTLTTNLIQIREPICCGFIPQPDITAFELATLLPYFIGKVMYEEDWKELAVMQRHFVRQP